MKSQVRIYIDHSIPNDVFKKEFEKEFKNRYLKILMQGKDRLEGPFIDILLDSKDVYLLHTFSSKRFSINDFLILKDYIKEHIILKDNLVLKENNIILEKNDTIILLET